MAYPFSLPMGVFCTHNTILLVELNSSLQCQKGYKTDVFIIKQSSFRRTRLHVFPSDTMLRQQCLVSIFAFRVFADGKVSCSVIVLCKERVTVVSVRRYQILTQCSFNQLKKITRYLEDMHWIKLQILIVRFQLKLSCHFPVTVLCNNLCSDSILFLILQVSRILKTVLLSDILEYTHVYITPTCPY